MSNFIGLEVPTGSVISCLDTYGISVNSNSSTLGDGWLTCNGGQHLASKYPDLYNVIGSTYNTGGESSGYFRVPDCQGVIPKCETSSIGTTGGSNTYTLTTATMPQHYHTFYQHDHIHWFTLEGGIYGDDFNAQGGNGGFYRKTVLGHWDGASNPWDPVLEDTYGVSKNSGAVSVSSGDTGDSFNAIPASKKVVFIIKT